MPARACLICGAPAITGLSRCSRHRRGGNPGPSPYDANHQRLAHQVTKVATVCAICGQPPTPTDPLQGDHIIPLSEGGRTVASNYQATHRSCNIRKGGRNRRGGGGVQNSRVY
jgi:5-methylcytosine-specific restriction endonuclease McrA